MKKALLSSLLMGLAMFVLGQNTWINELHYDNSSTDVGEFVEVVIENPGTYTLSDFAVHLYNGSNGTTYENNTLDNFTEGTTVGDYTIYTWYPSSIQNGGPDGLSLSYQGTVVTGQFLSYEGTLTATDGPANGLTSTDIGVEETGSTPVGESLQLSGGGTVYADFAWQDPADDTPGDENNNQSIGGTVTPTILNAYAISETAMEVEYSTDVSSVNAVDYTLTGTSTITFSSASIDGSNSALVHLTGASVNMTGDITLDNIDDDANASNYDFYAGIMPIANVNTTNPGGTMNDVNMATFQGVISANDNFNNVWISDADGAYNGVMIFNSSFDGLVSVGDEVLITAKRDTYNSLTELVDPELLATLSTGNSPYGPSIIDGSDIEESIAVDTDPGEKWEGQFVTIEDFTVDSYTDYDYTCSWSDGSSTYYFHVGDNVVYQFGGISMTVGETYSSITGVIDWYNSGPYYRINPREQSDIVETSSNTFIVGSFNGWVANDPDYLLTMGTTGLLELTKNLAADNHEYKVIDNDVWYPDNNNQQINLGAAEDITWKYNTDANLVSHTLPVVAGDFLSTMGGNDWDPTELMGEMEDPDGDDIYTLELTIPVAGNYECKVTLNNNWDQSTGGNIPFVSDGINATTFTYDFPNNTTTVSGPPPPTATVTFAVNDTLGKNYDGFSLKGSWDENGNYDPGWGGGIEHSIFYDDGTNGDTLAGDHIWMCEQVLTANDGSNTWEWGVNDTEGNWIAGNWQFTVVDDTPFDLSWDVPDEPALIINEIMYNSPGTDEEWVELYNATDASMDLENWKLIDSDASHTPIVIPAGYSIEPGGYFTIAVATGGAFPFTPDYDGTGNFALNNSGDDVRLYNNNGILIDIVSYSDSDPWPTAPDGDGPTLSLIDPDTDNSLPQSWLESIEIGGTPGAENFPPIPFVTVTSPSGGEFIEQGADFEITWIYGFWDGTIDIELVKEGQDPEPIVYSIPLSDGSFAWTVFENQELGDDYKVRISGIEGGDPVGESEDYFSIIEPYELPNIVITEIMYNPPESGDDSLEFLEFYNNSAETISMADFSISEGVEYTFPGNIEILPDTFLLVAKDSVAMMLTFGVEALQWTGGSLSNGGEAVELKDNFDIVVDYVPYDDYQPWDSLADGFGPSLTLCNPDADNSIAENWRASENFAAINAAGDSIWATPGFECQISLIAGFTSDKQVVIVGDSVMFTDQSSGDPVSWIWTFEGGTPESYEGQIPPYIVYEQAGMWDVTLVVSDGANSDSLTYQEFIHSGYAPEADFEADQTQVLAGSYTNFTSLSTGDNLTYEWTFEGGTPEMSGEENPVEIYYLIMDWDTYDVTLVVSNEFGSDTLLKEDYIEVFPENVFEKILTNQNVNLYPNPNQGEFTISIPANANAEIKIVDLQGRPMYYEKISGVHKLNVNALKKGIYFVKIYDADSGSQVVKRLVIR